MSFVEVPIVPVVTFRLGGQQYALEASAVQEIRSYQRLDAKGPKLPQYFGGWLNLRGILLSVLDLRSYNSLKHIEYNAFTVILILQVDGFTAGLVVDAVSEVLEVASDLWKSDTNDLPLGEFISSSLSLPERDKVLLLDHKQLIEKIKADLSLI